MIIKSISLIIIKIDMKILVISHNVFSQTNNMGKTLLNYFGDFDKEEICQIYFREDIPTEFNVCKYYYKMTDKDVLKSIINRKTCGRVIDEVKHVEKNNNFMGNVANLSSANKIKKIVMHWMRDIVWDIGNWNTIRLRNWLDEMRPDVIFFAQSDYKFAYKVACKIKEYLNIKMVMACVDDFYLYNELNCGVLGKQYYKAYMKVVRKTVDKCEFLFTICDSMGEKYTQLFNKKCITLSTPAIKKQLELKRNAKKISYIGNLNYGRYNQLIIIGRILKQFYNRKIDVYSPEMDPNICSQINDSNGLEFHGKIDSNEVLEVMRNSIAVIHVESNEEKYIARTKYSVSTKISESLMYGPCILAFGPKEVESINYLKRNNAAFVCEQERELKEMLSTLLNNEKERNKIIDNARRLAAENHDMNINAFKVRKYLKETEQRN